MTIKLLGTSHISPDSARQAEQLILSSGIDIVAIELDPPRLHALMSGEQETRFFPLVKAVGFWGAAFAVFGRWIEHKLGARIGMTPGAEMKAAVLAAARTGKLVALIDQPIQVTLRKFNKAFTWKERWRLFTSLFKRTKDQRFRFA